MEKIQVKISEIKKDIKSAKSQVQRIKELLEELKQQEAGKLSICTIPEEQGNLGLV